MWSMWPGFNDQFKFIRVLSNLDVTSPRQRIGAQWPDWLGHLSGLGQQLSAQCYWVSRSGLQDFVTSKQSWTLTSDVSGDPLILPSAINPGWKLWLLNESATAESRSAVMCTGNVTRGDWTNNRHHRDSSGCIIPALEKMKSATIY